MLAEPDVELEVEEVLVVGFVAGGLEVVVVEEMLLLLLLLLPLDDGPLFTGF